MANNTLIIVPADVTDEIELRRFLSLLMEHVDELFGLRGGSLSVTDVLDSLNQAAITDLAEVQITASPTYVQGEVQAIADQVQVLQTGINDILDRLRLTKIIV